MGNTIYARWLSGCNVIVQLSDYVFVHAGLGRWAAQIDPGRVNATVRAWIRFWQGEGSEPAPGTLWTVGKPDMARGSKWETGPAWNRSYKVKTNKKGKHRHEPQGDALSDEELQAILVSWGASRIVIGHAPVDSKEILMHHPSYGNKVIMADTRISERDGALCALQIRDGRLEEIRAESRKLGKSIRDEELERLKSSADLETERTGWKRWFAWMWRGKF